MEKVSSWQMSKVVDLVLRKGSKTRRKLMVSRRKCVCVCVCECVSVRGGGERWAERRQMTGSLAKLEQ